jgi:uncharacterized membrane protein YhhN
VVVSEFDRDWEEQEVDRRFDVINLVFGAALGAYVGIVLAKPGIRLSEIAGLTIFLVSLASGLQAIRTLLHVTRGTQTSPIWASVVSTAATAIVAFFVFYKNNFNLTVIVALLIGWVAALSTAFVVSWMRKRDDR